MKLKQKICFLEDAIKVNEVPPWDKHMVIDIIEQYRINGFIYQNYMSTLNSNIKRIISNRDFKKKVRERDSLSS